MWPETGKSVAGFTFNKGSRILKRRQFLALSRREPRAELVLTAGSFLVIGRKNGLSRNRLGVTVTKKVAPRAVARNRLKRQVREFFRLNRSTWPQGLDLLFIARHGAAQAAGDQLRDDLQRAGRKLSARAFAVTAQPGQAELGPDGLPTDQPAAAVESSVVPR